MSEHELNNIIGFLLAMIFIVTAFLLTIIHVLLGIAFLFLYFWVVYFSRDFLAKKFPKR